MEAPKLGREDEDNKEAEEEEEKKEKEELHLNLLKSKDPHLAGGE